MRNDTQDTTQADSVGETDNAMRNSTQADKPKKVVGTTYQCEHCQGDYQAKTTWQRFCSEACRLAANGVTDKAKMLRNKRKATAKA